MSIVAYDFSQNMPAVFHGASKTLSFTVMAYDGDGNPTGVQNITGWTLDFNVFDQLGNLVLTKTPTIPVGTDGVAQVPLTKTDTSATLGLPRYYAELSRIDPGSEDLLAYGFLTFKSPKVQ